MLFFWEVNILANRSRFGDDQARLKAMHGAERPDGVVVDPVPITAGEEVTILYKGALGQEGQGQVYLHYGFGRHDNWRNVSDLRMEKTGWGWVGSVVMPEYEGRFNMCFRDDAYNWDNNNRVNWSFQIHNGSQRC